MLKELSALDSTIAARLLTSLEFRINERRQIGLATLLAYLKKPKFLETTDKLRLPYANKEQITRLAKILYDRLFQNTFPEEKEAQNDNPSTSTSRSPPVKRSKRKQQELRDYVESEEDEQNAPLTSFTLRGAIEDAMKLYEGSKERPEMLNKVIW